MLLLKLVQLGLKNCVSSRDNVLAVVRLQLLLSANCLWLIAQVHVWLLKMAYAIRNLSCIQILQRLRVLILSWTAGQHS